MDIFHGDPGMVDGNIVVCEVPKALYAELYKLFCKLFGLGLWDAEYGRGGVIVPAEVLKTGDMAYRHVFDYLTCK